MLTLIGLGFLEVQKTGWGKGVAHKTIVYHEKTILVH